MAQLRIPAVLAGLLLGTAMLSSAQAATATRTSAFEYDPASGLLTKAIIEPDNAQLRLETTYGYDAFGNKLSATVSSPATGAAAIAARTSSNTYDTRGQFPTSSTNALGQTETKTYDPRFGTISSLTGPNGLTTQWQYDSFGRKILEIRADGNQTKWDYLYCNGVNNGTATCPTTLAKYLVLTTPLASDGATPNGAWSKTYFDALDRPIRFETLGFDGTSVILQDTEYDNLGRVSRTSMPYYRGQTAQWSTVSYDAIGRVIATTAPDNTQTTAVYNGLTSSVTNALNQTTTTVKNSQGQKVKVTDPVNNSLTYQYDPFGNLTQTTDPKGNIITLSYDIRGRKFQMVDPDMGTWRYDYDVLGQLIKQTDAKNQVATMTYDKLGRMTNRAEPDLVSTWTYDSCTKGVGKLCKATTDNGYVQVPSYDNLGRAVSTTTTLDTAYTASVTFDANGRVATRTYPNGLVVKYGYTSLGYLAEVRNNATNALYWQANTIDAQGHLLQQTYGNNIVTQQVFESTTGRLKNIYAGAGNGVQNLAFSYDNLGNLQSRNDANQNLNETFLYDSLNRLTSSTVNSGGAGVVTQSYGYDSIGNITSRSDIGTYTYGVTNSQPHAITQITLAGGGKRTYAYDVNGNLVTEAQYDANNAVINSKGRTEVYTSFNMPQALGAPGISLAFAYGPDHQRVKQIAPAATTIYLHPDNSGGLFYEKDLKADGGVEHRNFITAGGSVVAIVKQTGSITKVAYLHGDHLGSNSAVTDEAGVVIERLAYEPFGKRRTPAGSMDPNNTLVGVNTDRGYTNHEHLDELGLIHMNGRIYDPALGRFMSADPFIQAPGNIQSYNRYAYVMNGPMSAIDPSGYFDNPPPGGTYYAGNDFNPYLSGGSGSSNYNVGVNFNLSGGSSSSSSSSSAPKSSPATPPSTPAPAPAPKPVPPPVKKSVMDSYTGSTQQPTCSMASLGCQSQLDQWRQRIERQQALERPAFGPDDIALMAITGPLNGTRFLLGESLIATKELGSVVFVAKNGIGQLFSPNVLLANDTIAFTDFSVGTARGFLGLGEKGAVELLGPMRELVVYGQQQGAKWINLSGKYMTEEGAALGGGNVHDYFSFTFEASREGLKKLLNQLGN